MAGPDGGPLIAERGIGGTGAPESAVMRTADRGIGGTGIVGVVTGFGSVFVDGVEIRYDDSARVDTDGTASPASDLRAGQLVAIRASGPPTAPYATTISVRSAVSGRIEAVAPGTGLLTVGGQAVLVPDGTWGAHRFGLGDWVKVSGLRRGDGTIVASRLDSAPAGVLMARGRVIRDGAVARVGGLLLRGSAAEGVKDGDFVVVSGGYAAGQGQVSSVVPDTLFPNPAAYFGASANRLIVQAFVHVDKGVLAMNGARIPAEPAVSDEAGHDGVAIVSLERGSDGSYTAVRLRYAGYGGSGVRPFDGRPGAEPRHMSQAPRRNGHITAAAAAPREHGVTSLAATGRLTTVSASDELDLMKGRSVTPASPVQTHPTLASNPVMPDTIVAPAVPEASVTQHQTNVAGSPDVTRAAPGVSDPVSAAGPRTTPPIAGLPPVGQSPAAPPAKDPLISSTGSGRTVTAQALEKARRLAIERARARSRAVTLKGSGSGPPINLVTGAETSGTTAGSGAGPSKASAAGTAGKDTPVVSPGTAKPANAGAGAPNAH